MSNNYETRRYTIISSLLLPPSQKKTIPSVPCFEHCHVLPLMWVTKFHNHTKPSNNRSQFSVHKLDTAQLM